MAKNLDIYKCSACGNIVEVVHGGVGSLTCCGAPMQLMVENTVDASREKHVPIIEQGDGFVTITVGSVPHPMEEAHHIEWIELIADGNSYRQFLKPGTAAKATFALTAKEFTVREYCNLHGQWSATN